VPTLGVFFYVPLGFDSGMYLRYTTRKKDGKTLRYWRLVRSVRVGRRVIQQTVVQLRELDEHGRLEARALARHLIGEPHQVQRCSYSTMAASTSRCRCGPKSFASNAPVSSVMCN
jgi:hypothetical protein